jgi:hypothetical protein
MEGIRVYKEMLVTYGELAHALTQLGFVEDTTSPHFQYINEKKDSAALLKKKAANEFVAKINLAGLSYQLYLQKNRMPKKAKKLVAVPQ